MPGRKTQSNGQRRKTGAHASGLHPVHRREPRISHRGVGLTRSPLDESGVFDHIGGQGRQAILTTLRQRPWRALPWLTPLDEDFEDAVLEGVTAALPDPGAVQQYSE